MEKLITSFIDVIDHLNVMIRNLEQERDRLRVDLETTKSRKKPGRPAKVQEDEADDDTEA